MSKVSHWWRTGLEGHTWTTNILSLQRLSRTTPVPPSHELSLGGSPHPTPPMSEAACWPISANRGMTSVALTSWPVSGTCPGAAVHLHALKVGRNIDVNNNSWYLITFYPPVGLVSSWCKEKIWCSLILDAYIVSIYCSIFYKTLLLVCLIFQIGHRG